MLTKWETILVPCKACEGHGGCYTVVSCLSDDVLKESSIVFRERNLVGDRKLYYLCRFGDFFFFFGLCGNAAGIWSTVMAFKFIRMLIKWRLLQEVLREA